MGKVIYFLTADFSTNAIPGVDPGEGPTPPTPPTPTGNHNYLTFTLVASGSTRACYNTAIERDKSIGFDNDSYWSTYKMALSYSGQWPSTALWSTWYDNTASSTYLQKNVIVMGNTTNPTGITQIMITRVDGTNITDSDITTINAHFYCDSPRTLGTFVDKSSDLTITTTQYMNYDFQNVIYKFQGEQASNYALVTWNVSSYRGKTIKFTVSGKSFGGGQGYSQIVFANAAASGVTIPWTGSSTVTNPTTGNTFVGNHQTGGSADTYYLIVPQNATWLIFTNNSSVVASPTCAVGTAQS